MGDWLKSLGRHMPRERYQRGHLEKTGKLRKMWRGHWFVYEVTPEGEKRRHKEKILGACSELSKRDAQDLLDQLIRSASLSTPKQMDGVTVKEFGARYREMKNKGWSPHWRSVMHSLWERHIDPKLGSVRLRDLRREQIQNHINQLHELGLSFSIIHKVRTHLKAMLDEAIESDLIVKNPARLLDMPRMKRPPKIFLSEQQCLTLLMSTKRTRDHLILRLALTLGLRPSELFALRGNDLFPGSLRIDEAYVQGCLDDPKTLHSKGFVSLPLSLEIELRAYIHANGIKDEDFLFSYRNGKPLRSGNYSRRQLRTIASRAGIPVLSFQIIRRTFATHIQSHATLKDIQGAMRHAKPDLTAEVYMQELPEGVKNAVNTWDHRLSIASKTIN